MSDQPKPSCPSGNFVENNDFKLSFKIGSDKESGIIALQDFIDKYSKELSTVYFDTREKAIQAELKKLGWISPEENAELKELVEELEKENKTFKKLHLEFWHRCCELETQGGDNSVDITDLKDKLTASEAARVKAQAQNATLREALCKISRRLEYAISVSNPKEILKIIETALSSTSETSVSRRLAIYEKALKVLSNLGNGEKPGNSDGNCIAQQALQDAKALK